MYYNTHTYQTLCTQEAQEQARKDAEVRRKKIEALRVRLVIRCIQCYVCMTGNENKVFKANLQQFHVNFLYMSFDGDTLVL